MITVSLFKLLVIKIDGESICLLALIMSNKVNQNNYVYRRCCSPNSCRICFMEEKQICANTFLHYYILLIDYIPIINEKK